MSTDMVDIIQDAEEHLESLRTTCRIVIAARDELAQHNPGSANYAFAWGTLQAMLVQLDQASEERWMRPGCEEVDDGPDGSTCLMGDDCGGFHPWVEE